MKNNTRKTSRIAIMLMSLLMFVGLLFLLTGFADNATFVWAYGDELYLADYTIYSTATLDDDFECDTILVVLTRGASRNFSTLTPMDFPEVELAEVRCITPGLWQAQAQIAASVSRRANSLYYDANLRIDLNQFRQILKLRLANPSRENVLDAISLLQRRDDIRSVEPNVNFEVSNSFETNYIQDIIEPLSTDIGLWNLNNISLGAAHGITRGISMVRVGVLSTGIDISRPDLSVGRVYPVMPRGADHLTGSQNFHPSDMSSPLTDPAGHGTHIAGTIVGATTGVAPNVRVVSLKVATGPETRGRYNPGAMIAAIEYAGQNDPVRSGIRIPILSLSLDTITANAHLEQAILNFPGVFVMGSGNSGRQIFRPNTFNALEGERVIRVGASMRTRPTIFHDWREERGVRSNFSSSYVCIFAPGYDIRSTVPTHVHNSGFRNWNGTSFAAPHVAGTAALMLSVNPELSAREVRNIIRAMADGDESGVQSCIINHSVAR